MIYKKVKPYKISGLNSVQYSFTLYSHKVNPDYHAQITFTNSRNPQNTVQLQVNAIIIASQSESIHAQTYTLSVNNAPATSLKFASCSSTFPATMFFTLKNKLETPIELTLKSAHPNEVFVYSETPPVSRPTQMFLRPDFYPSVPNGLPSVSWLP